MPRLISEISAGQQFQRSSQDGRLADSQVRTFRILINPGEVVNVEAACGIKVGDQHPFNTNIYCTSWDAKLEGDSRTVIVATFNYQSTPSAGGGGADPKQYNPEVRPANWSTSTSLIEVPVQWWGEVPQGNGGILSSGPAVNPAGDLYDGVSKFEAIVTINIEQHEPTDPTRHCLFAGCVNQEEISVGSLSCPPGSVMFRGIQSKPVVENYGGNIYRGWMASYEFAFRRNKVYNLYYNGNVYDAEIGWDIAVPQTGFNVKCLLNAQNVDKAGMPLRHTSGKIDNWPNGVALADGVAAGRKARAMVLVHSYEDGGASQLPSAQPIPLNSDGSPRIDTATPKVIVRRYRTNDMVNFTQAFGLRLT